MYTGMAIIKQQFPEHFATFSPSTYALSCLLHDIGTTEANMTGTHMSFEFFGAILSLNLLQHELHAPRDQAEAVCETIIRHQDLGKDGKITLLGQVIQLATIYDNVGAHPGIENFGEMLSRETREDVNRKFKRGGWLGCFAQVVKRETGLKPWCHTTHIPGFEGLVEGNELMRPYE
jgi:cyanamide hydratase